MPSASSERRKATRDAAGSGGSGGPSFERLSGALEVVGPGQGRTGSHGSGVDVSQEKPGATELTRIPSPDSSWERFSVSRTDGHLRCRVGVEARERPRRSTAREGHDGSPRHAQRLEHRHDGQQGSDHVHLERSAESIRSPGSDGSDGSDLTGGGDHPVQEAVRRDLLCCGVPAIFDGDVELDGRVRAARQVLRHVLRSGAITSGQRQARAAPPELSTDGEAECHGWTPSRGSSVRRARRQPSRGRGFDAPPKWIIAHGIASGTDSAGARSPELRHEVLRFGVGERKARSPPVSGSSPSFGKSV